jgi:hypothetical protein
MHVHFFYKHGSNPQITIDTSPKPSKIPLFKHGLGVDSWDETWVGGVGGGGGGVLGKKKN